MAAVLEAFLKNEAIRINFAKLVRGMETDRVSIANQCYAKGLMPQVMLHATPTDMLNAIQGQVAADGTGNIFQSFCDILEEENSTAYLAQSLLKSLQLLRSRERYRPKKLCKKVTNPNLDPTSFPTLSDSFEIQDCTKLDEIQQDITSDVTSDEDEDDKSEEDSEEDMPNLGYIESVTNPNFDNNYQTNRRYRRTSTSPRRPSYASLPTSPLRKRMDSLTIRDPQDRSPDRKCCRHRMEINKLVQEKNDMEQKFKEALLWERGKHQQKVKLMKWERRQHMRKMKHKMCHLRLWLKESQDREEQLHKKMQYMDLYYEEIKGYNSQLQLRLQVEQERHGKCQDQKDRLREKVSALESLLTVSQEDCHRHYIAEIQLREKVRELEEKVSELEPKSGRDSASIEASHHFDYPDPSPKYLSGYSPGHSSGHISSHTSHHITPLATPLASPLSQSHNHPTNWSPNSSLSHTPDRSSSPSPNSSSHSQNYSP